MATTSSTTSTTSGGASIQLSGLGSGLDTASIIDQLISVEAQPQTKLKTQLANHQSEVSIYQTLNSAFAALKTATQDMALGFNWKATAASSSNSNIAVTSTGTATTGSMAFTVKQLATAQTQASFGSVASLDTVIGTGSMLVGTTGNLGISGMKGTGLTTGAHTIAVTQASTGATVKGSALANTTTLAADQTLNYSVNGTAKSLTIPAGSYTQAQLAKLVTDGSGGSLSASVNADKSLSLASTREGSAATLSITGGTALSSLGIASGASATGTNGIVTVDGVATTVTDVRPDGSNTVTANGTAGSVALNFSGGLRIGSSSINNIDLGDGKLSTVVTAINNANVGVTAAAVQVGPGQFKLQTQSTTTGSAGGIGIDITKFSGTLGEMATINKAQDAQLQIGSDTAGYTVSSSSNSVSTLLSGVTIDLSNAKVGDTSTITIDGDSKGLGDKVAKMISAANDAIKLINDNSKYDSSSKTAGAFLGNSTASRLVTMLHNAISGMVSGGNLKLGTDVGITSNDDGSFTFDQTKFTAAYKKNPQDVANLFVQGGTTSISDGTNPGLAERMLSVAKAATDSVSGYITTAIAGENSTINDLQKSIDDWDDRLAKRRQVLQQMYTAMDTAVANLHSQGNWLSGQISGLASNS